MIRINGRNTIGKPDKLFGVSALAKARIAEIGKENVINSTLGVLLDDNGKLVVLSSVMEALHELRPEEFAAYAPIIGIPEYKEAVTKAVFLDEVPQDLFIETCYAPGGTGALRNAISCYSSPGDKILTADWHWAPYNVIAAELGREVKTYTLFDEDYHFNDASFRKSLSDILAVQDQAVVIINTPAHNPTGYTFTLEDWDKVIDIFKSFPHKNIICVVDIAYLDFAGEAHAYRAFLKKLSGLPHHILPLIAFSASKGFTMYGMRCGALLCMAPTADLAKEFRDAASVASRASWSNGNHSAMAVISKIFADDALLAKVTDERNHYMQILQERGRAFMEEANKIGLKCCPYDSGFFITVPCENAEEVGKALQALNVFAIPLGPGIRVSVASNTVEECRAIPGRLQQAIESVNGK